MLAKEILYFVGLLILHFEFVMKKTCPSDFYLINFPFFGNYCIFTHLFDFVCHVDVHEPCTTSNSDCDVTRGLKCSGAPRIWQKEGGYNRVSGG